MGCDCCLRAPKNISLGDGCVAGVLGLACDLTGVQMSYDALRV